MNTYPVGPFTTKREEPPSVVPGTCAAPGDVITTDTSTYAYDKTYTDTQVVVTARLLANDRFVSTSTWTYELTEIAQLGPDDPACRVPVKPEPPTATLGTCDAKGVVSLPDAKGRYSWTFTETDSGVVTYTAEAATNYTIAPDARVSWDFNIAQLAPDSAECLPAVLPVNVITQAQVTPNSPTCDADGSLTLTNGESFTWSDTGALAVGTHEVTATAADGYVFADQKTTAKFTVKVLPATGEQSTDATAGCYVAPVVVLPVVDPPVVVPVVVDPTVTPVAAVVSSTPAVSNRVLAYTGIDGLPWLLLGAAGLIGFGALTVSRSSRERRVRA